MSKRVKKHFGTIKALCKLKPNVAKAVIHDANDEVIKCICECIQNVLNGVVKIPQATKRKLKRHKRKIRQINNKRIGIRRKRKLLEQSGGFLPMLLAPVVGLLGSVVGEAISSAIRK